VLPRLSGCTISPDGSPLTTAGYRRIRRWREQWLAGTAGVVPAVGLLHGMLTGVAALAYLADLATTAAAPPRAGRRAAPAVHRVSQRA
jgi:hypothetical protein